MWEIYQNYLANKVIIKPSQSPIGDILRLAKDNPQDEIYFVIGFREGNDDDMKDIDKILAKYLKPFSPKNTKPKTPAQRQLSDERKAKDRREIQSMLSDEFIDDILQYTSSKEEAQTAINQFING